MSTLVLIGGPPAVGKSSVLPYLARGFDRCACLDGDEAWRIHPFEVNDVTRALAERNILAVLRGYLEAGYPTVFLCWVLPNRQLIERLLRELDGLYRSAVVVHLIASPEVLEARCRLQPERDRRIETAVLKLEQIEALPYHKIDTTDLTAGDVAGRIIRYVKGHRSR